MLRGFDYLLKFRYTPLEPSNSLWSFVLKIAHFRELLRLISGNIRNLLRIIDNFAQPSALFRNGVRNIIVEKFLAME